MTDRNRNQDPPNRDQPDDATRADREELDQSESSEPNRSTRDRQSVADDRPLRGGREDVDVGTDMEREPGLDQSDEEIEAPDRSNR